MHIHKSRKLLALVILGMALKADAQYITQLGVSNYGPVHSYHLNPSFNAYSAFKWQVNLAGLWANVNNNYLTLKLPYSAYRLPNNIPVQYLSESGNPLFNKSWLNERLNGRVKHVSVASDVYGPSASVKIKSWSVGFISQASADARVSAMPENLAHAMFKEFDSAQGAYNQFIRADQGGLNSVNEFTVNGNSRISAGLNVSRSIDLAWNRKLLLGVTVKKVWGLPGFHMHNSGMSVRAVTQDSLVFEPTDLLLVTYGDDIGKGAGVDLGATYVFNKKDFKRHGEYSKNVTRYFCKLGVAIMDIGKINYSNAQFNEVSIDQPTGINLDGSYGKSLPNNSNYQAMADSFMNQFANHRSYTGNYSVGLPTRLVLSADFQLRKRIFLAGVVTQSLRGRMSKHSRYQSFLMVSPRWESRFFEFSLPLLLEYDYRSVRMGASARIGPLYVGTNSLASFLYTRGLRDADIFVGIAFGNLSDFSFRKLARTKKHKNRKANTGQNCGVF
jgi:hypothetical protein